MKKTVEIDFPDFLPRIIIPLISVPTEAAETVFTSIAYFPFNKERYSGYDVLNLNFYIELAAGIDVRVLHGPDILALADNLESTGVHLIPMTMPSTSGLIELQIRRKGTGDNPTLYSCTMELDE